MVNNYDSPIKHQYYVQYQQFPYVGKEANDKC
jgi:hypothetical protein